MCSISSLLLLLDPLCPGVEGPVRVPFKDQIELFNRLLMNLNHITVQMVCIRYEYLINCITNVT